MTCPIRGLMRRLSSRAALDDPHPIYRALREAGPIHDLPHFGPAFTRYGDVRAVLFDRSMKVSSEAATPGSARANIAAHLPQDLRRLPAPLFLLDEPDHKRLRKIVAARFSQSAVDALRPRITAIAHALIDAIEDRATFDFIEAFAAPLPAQVIAHILGVGDEHREAFRAWSEAVIHELHPLAGPEEREAAIAAHRALVAFFREEVARRRRAPRNDLIGELVEAEAQGSLSEDEVISLSINLLVAGHFTTTDLIGVLTYLLLSHPDQLQQLKRDPKLWPQAVDEALRFEPPTPLLARVHAKPAHAYGWLFDAGDTINVFIASANRDPRMFEKPERFDITREDNPHLSFGGGAHYCLGAPLARVEAEIAVRALMERLPRLALAEADACWRQTPNFRGLARLLLKRPRAPRSITAPHKADLELA